MIYIYTDGMSLGNPGRGFWGFIVYQDTKVIFKKNGYIGDNITNNIAEYTGAIEALRWFKEHTFEFVEIHSDSELMVNQIVGQYKCLSEHLKPLLNEVQKLVSEIEHQNNRPEGSPHRIHFNWIPREDNVEADTLCWEAYFTNFVQQKREENADKLTPDDIQILPDGNFVVHGHKINKERNDCDCEDFQFKCKKMGIKCKHLILLERYLSFLEKTLKTSDKKVTTSDFRIQSFLLLQQKFDELDKSFGEFKKAFEKYKKEE